MYKSVPPPELHSQAHGDSATVGTERPGEEGDIDYTKPDNVANEQWKKFQELKARRMVECGQTETRRKAALKNKALRTVSKEFSESDKQLLVEDGVTLPEVGPSRKRSRTHHPSLSSGHVGSHAVKTSTKDKDLERRWGEVKMFLDPNPQLRGLDKGKYADKSELEEKMDDLIEMNQFEEAAAMSDKLAQRDFATNVATAFDCQEYSKKKKVEDERRKAKKKKSKSFFPPKQKWESKGNM